MYSCGRDAAIAVHESAGWARLSYHGRAGCIEACKYSFGH